MPEAEEVVAAATCPLCTGEMDVAVPRMRQTGYDARTGLAINSNEPCCVGCDESFTLCSSCSRLYDPESGGVSHDGNCYVCSAAMVMCEHCQEYSDIESMSRTT